MRKPLVLTIVLCAISLITVRAQQYNFTNYGLSEGLAQSQVYDILEDEKGYIWMATNGGGLSRFDGLEFKTFTVKDGLSSNYVLSLFQDSTGTLWIGTAKGLCRYNGQTIEDLMLWESPTRVSVIHWDSNHGLLIGSDHGVFQWQDSVTTVFQSQNYANQGNTSFIESDTQGALWVGSNTGIVKIDTSSTYRMTVKNGLISNLTLCLEEDENGDIWMGAYGGGLNHYNGKDFGNRRDIPELQDAIVNDIHADASGLLWIATLNKGLCIYHPKDSSYRFLNEKSGLANNNVDCLLKDSWGNYWMGTSGGGSSKYSGQQFQYYNRANGLKGAYIYSLTKSYKNQLWLGSSDGGITRFDGSDFISYKSDSGFSDVKAKALLQASDSLLWVGTEGKGIAVFNGDTFVTYTTNDGLSGNWVKALIEDKSQNIWAATAGGGITRITKTDSTLVFKKLRQEDGLASNRVIHLYVDSLNRVWYASRSGGIGCIINDSTIVNFKVGDGLNSNTARSLSEDAFGKLWIGTSQGIHSIPLYEEELRIDSAYLKEELSSFNVYLLTHDYENNLWVGTEKGLDKLLMDEEGSVLEFTHYGRDDGFDGVETNINAVHTEPSGDIWFGTVNGLHKYLSEVSLKNEKAPILHFTSVTINYKDVFETTHAQSYLQHAPLELAYEENNLVVDFAGITQTYPKKVQYQWRLLGLEEDWSPVSKRNSVNFLNLSPGDYSLEVRSANEDDVWNEAPIRLPFQIALPWWEENWFVAGYIGLSSFLLILIVSLRVRYVRRKARAKQEKLISERDRLDLEQKALRLQMNPHFIFHTLNSIQALIASKEEDVARSYLSKFSKLMRQILENSRIKEIHLDDELEMLRNYLGLEQFCRENKFDFEIVVEENLEVDFIKIPSMIIQPYLENAILHGLGNAAKKGLLRLELKDEGEVLKCIVTDNGIGRAQAQKLKLTSNRSHKSTAMEVTSERLRLLTEREDSVEIRDLYDAQGAASGTQVILRLPILGE